MTADLDTVELRRCGRCGEVRPVAEFAWRRRARGQRDNYCRECRAAYKQAHYAANRQRYVAAALRRRVAAAKTRRCATTRPLPD